MNEMKRSSSSMLSPDNSCQMSLFECWGRRPDGKSNDLPVSRCSSSKRQSLSGATEVPICPVCDQKLWYDMALTNLHIDGCLFRVQNQENCTRNAKEDVTNSHVSENEEQSLPNYKITKKEVPAGLVLVEDFITEQEELELIKVLDEDDRQPWKFSSFNGNCYSKSFGYVTQFGLPDELRLVRKNNELAGEYNIPPEFQRFVDRLHRIVAANMSQFPSEVRDFKPNECNSNSYRKSENHYLRPHYDDRTLSGPLLMNLSLAGSGIMTYVRPSDSSSVEVSLPRRCLQIVTGAARWYYTHEIKQHHILDERRVSITWRQAGGKKGVLLSEAQSGKDVSTQLRQHSQSKTQ